jgi:hypothetical protein
MNTKILKMGPYLLALVVMLFSMRDVKTIHFKHIDSTHHALNGAFVYDLVRTGNLAHPVAFAKQYYSRFPGITIPYHPPLFPFVEALFYSVFGVTFFAARLSVATAAGIVAFLMFRLVKSTHQSDSLAFAATISFMALPISQYSAADVMLEFPALAFTLGALYCLRDLDKGYPWSRAYPFALLSAAAVWTKQHAVFLGLVPFIIILLHGNWRLLRGLNLWASSVILGVAILALTRLSAPVSHVGVSKQFAAGQTLWPATVNNVTYYGIDLRSQVGLVAGTWLLLSVGAFLLFPSLRRRRENHLYLAWILALVPVLLPAANRDIRYLLFGMAAFLVLGYESLRLACMRVLPARYVPAVIGIVAICMSSHMIYRVLGKPHTYAAHTPIAHALKDRACRRVLYCGERPMYLALAMRYDNPDSGAIMIRGDKLDPAIFTPDGLERFAWRYGVDTIVLEPGKKPHPWDFLFEHPTKSMECNRVVSGETSIQNRTLIFVFTNPSSTPESTLDVRLSSGNGDLNLQF